MSVRLLTLSRSDEPLLTRCRLGRKLCPSRLDGRASEWKHITRHELLTTLLGCHPLLDHMCVTLQYIRRFDRPLASRSARETVQVSALSSPQHSPLD